MSTGSEPTPQYSATKNLHDGGIHTTKHALLTCRDAVTPSDAASEPNLHFDGETVVIRLFHDAHNLCDNFFVDAYDKVIIPYTKLEITYSIRNNPVTLQLLPGEGFFVPSGCNDLRITSISSHEYLMMDIDESVRLSVSKSEEKPKPDLFQKASILRNAQYLLEFARTARRLLLSSIGANLTTVKALGVMAAAEILVSLKGRAKAHLSLTRDMLIRLDEYINDNIDKTLKLEQLADRCRMSTPHFSRMFKSATGRSPYQYILDRRLLLSRQLLKTTNRSIAEIAYDVGFSSQSHLTEVFRKSIGTTPAKYRNISLSTAKRPNT